MDINQNQPKAETHWKRIPNSGFPLSFPCGVRTHCLPGALRDIMCWVLPIKEAYWAPVSRALTGLPLCRYDWWSPWPQCWIQALIPLSSWGLGQYQLAPSPNPLITQLVFLAWSAPILSHLLRTESSDVVLRNPPWTKTLFSLGKFADLLASSQELGTEASQILCRGQRDSKWYILVWIRYESLLKQSKERDGVKGAGFMDLEAGDPSVLEMDIFILPACRCVGKNVWGVFRVRKRPEASFCLCLRYHLGAAIKQEHPRI